MLLASAAPSKADVITTFALNGTFVLQVPGNPTLPLSSAITIDTTTGTVTSQTLLGSIGPVPPAITQGYNNAAMAYLLVIANQISGYDLYFDTASLVGYTGGNLGSTAFPTPGGAVSSYGAQLLPPTVLSSGTATPAVPEPAAAGLLLLGLAGTVLVTRRRCGAASGRPGV